MSQAKNKILIELILVVLVLLPCKGICTEEVKSLSKGIFNHWIHSHEDDTKDIKVFRPSTYNFPRSRGRIGFEFKKNGEFIEYRIAPADGLVKLHGHWRLLEKNKIEIQFKDKKIKPYLIMIISVDEDILKIKKSF